MVLVDCDATLFYPYRDVDDSLALGYVLRRFEGLVAGVTAVYGNNSVECTYRDAKRVVEAAGARVPVARGAGSSRELGRPSGAARLIADVCREYGDVVVLATGPLTNVATALLLYPEVADAVKRVVVMGGAVYRRGNVPVADAEFNFWCDPRAAELVLRGYGRVELAPLDVTTRVKWGVDALERLAGLGDPLARFLARAAKPWARFWSPLGGFNPHDVVAAVYLSRPELYRVAEVELSVVTSGVRRGKVLAGRGRRVRVMLGVDPGGLLEEYLSAFARRA